MRPRLVDRSCGESLMFNPASLECDWPLNVGKVRPMCKRELKCLLPTEQLMTEYCEYFLAAPTTLPPLPSSQPTVASSPLPSGGCDTARPHIEHETDCSKFYHCVPGAYGGHPRRVLKECGPGTLFNPQTMTCDWPNVVTAIKPECAPAGKYGWILRIH